MSKLCITVIAVFNLFSYLLHKYLNKQFFFASRADFSKEPAFHWMKQLSTEVKVAIKKSKVLFCNGYGFDDLSPDLLLSAVECAVEAGTAVFFDPGPRGRSLSTGTPEEQRAFYHFLRMSDVLLLTSDEVSFLVPLR